MNSEKIHFDLCLSFLLLVKVFLQNIAAQLVILYSGIAGIDGMAGPKSEGSAPATVNISHPLPSFIPNNYKIISSREFFALK